MGMLAGGPASWPPGQTITTRGRQPRGWWRDSQLRHSLPEDEARVDGLTLGSPASEREAPGVGLEPTTSRLTVERICQLSYPGSCYPGRGPGAQHCTRSIRLSQHDDAALDLRMAVGAEDHALLFLGPQGGDRRRGSPGVDFVALARRFDVVEVQRPHVA